MTHTAPRSPLFYKVPGIVQPKWSYLDLVKSLSLKSWEEDLQKQLTQRYGVRYCVLLDDARSAVYMLAKYFGLNNEWITTSYMYDPLYKIIKDNCSGIALADINNDLTVDRQSIEELIDYRTEVLMVNHFFGKCSDVKGLKAIADKNKLFLLENCVHVPGDTAVDDKPIGSWGDASIVSFKADKSLGGIGGGALLTNRLDVYNCIKNNLAKEKKLYHSIGYILSNSIAYKSRKYIALAIFLKNKYSELFNSIPSLDESFLNIELHNSKIGALQAKLALTMFGKIDKINKDQEKKCKLICDMFEGMDEIYIPRNENNAPHAYTYFPLILQNIDRMRFADNLARQGIETKWRYDALHKKYYSNGIRWNDLSKTNNIINQHILLPISYLTTYQDIDYIAECVIHEINNLKSKNDDKIYSSL